MYSTARYGRQVNAPCKSDRFDRVDHPTYWLLDTFGGRVVVPRVPWYLYKLRGGRDAVYSISWLAEMWMWQPGE